MTIEVTPEDFKDPVYFQCAFLGQTPHKKQIEVLRSKAKNKIIVCGRRSGKTQMISAELIRGAYFPLYKRQMVIAPVYKQSMIVYDKILQILFTSGVYDAIIKQILKSPHPKIIFKNGSEIHFGSADNYNSLRGENYARIFIDESAFIKEEAWNAIRPLTFDTGAPIWETTSPSGKGSVWERWRLAEEGDEDFANFHYNYKDNPYLKEDGIKMIEKEIEEFGETSYYVQCEIYGNFMEDRDAYFKRDLIDSCIEEYPLVKAESDLDINKEHFYFLGVDIARMGEDSTVFVVVEREQNGMMKVVWIDQTKHTRITDTTGAVNMLDKIYNFTGIYLDETGLGAGAVDVLREQLGPSKIIGVTFTVGSKQDIYSTLKSEMEREHLKLPKHKRLRFELLDLRYEKTSRGDLKIHHSEKGHDDFPDALALAVWGGSKRRASVSFRAF